MTTQELTLILEFCANGSLKSYLEDRIKPALDDKLSKLALRKMASKMGDDGYPENVENRGQSETDEL